MPWHSLHAAAISHLTQTTYVESLPNLRRLFRLDGESNAEFRTRLNHALFGTECGGMPTFGKASNRLIYSHIPLTIDEETKKPVVRYSWGPGKAFDPTELVTSVREMMPNRNKQATLYYSLDKASAQVPSSITRAMKTAPKSKGRCHPSAVLRCLALNEIMFHYRDEIASGSVQWKRSNFESVPHSYVKFTENSKATLLAYARNLDELLAIAVHEELSALGRYQIR